MKLFPWLHQKYRDLDRQIEKFRQLQHAYSAANLSNRSIYSPNPLAKELDDVQTIKESSTSAQFMGAA